jgi:photosystem II stability/assembly factor-like uncharacterized protein
MRVSGLVSEARTIIYRAISTPLKEGSGMTFRNERVIVFLMGIGVFSLFGCINTKTVKRVQIRWKIQTSGTTASFRSVSAVSSRICWVSGSRGTVLRTVNGGEDWLKLEIPEAESLDFRDVQAFNASTALVISAGLPAKIVKTTDGGETWHEKYSNSAPGIFFDAMSFWDDQNGIAFGDPLDGQLNLIRTTDSGESWHRIPPESFPVPKEGEAGFAASGTCLTVFGDSLAWFGTGGSAARVFRSTNRGDTWTVSDTPILSGNPPEGIFSIVFKDALNGVIVGGNYQNPTGNQHNAAWTSDGGLTWRSVSGHPPGGFRECAVYVSRTLPDILLTVGPSGSDISQDGGRTWTQEDTVGYHAAGFPEKKKVGWAVGAEGRIVRITFNQ